MDRVEIAWEKSCTARRAPRSFSTTGTWPTSKLVIGAKLRRKESFFFTWKEDPSTGEGRNSIWIDAAIPLYFKYFGSKPPTINREWLELLTLSANSAQGMQFIVLALLGAAAEVVKGSKSA